MTQEPTRIPSLAKEIVLYYLRNQKTADTLEGLARWRLQEERVHRTLREVQRALDWLVSQGFLQARTRGARTIFTLNESRAEELATLLREAEQNGAEPGGTGLCRA